MDTVSSINVVTHSDYHQSICRTGDWLFEIYLSNAAIVLHLVVSLMFYAAWKGSVMLSQNSLSREVGVRLVSLP